MKIHCSLALNNNETYCCSKKSIKDTFGERDVEVSFGRFQFYRNQRDNSLYFFPKDKGEIMVLAVLNVQKRRKHAHTIIREVYSRLSIQRIEKKRFSDEQKEYFAQKLLPKMVAFFDEYIDYDVTYHQRSNIMIIGLRGEEWIIETKKEFHIM
ncbi:MAG: hypothetical protein IJX31_04605 [Clostridia bacterium]|nr:hypothetical protein [Clostridia bacterium]